MSDDAKIIEEVGNAAYENEKTYHGCSQCVLGALQNHLDLGDDLTFKAASALAGGGNHPKGKKRVKMGSPLPFDIFLVSLVKV